MSTANAIINEKLRRRGARLQTHLERELAFIKPVRQDILTHEASDGSILEPTLVWATQEFRALDRLFGVHAELDRLRKQRRGQTSHRRLSLKRTEQHLRRLLLAFQKERQARCEEVLRVARAHAEKEEAERVSLRKELEGALAERQDALDQAIKCRGNLEMCEEKLKCALTEGIQGKHELEESCIRANRLEEELRAVKRSLEQERTRGNSEAVHCDLAKKECAQAMEKSAFHEERSDRMAGEAGQAFVQMGLYLDVVGTENRDIRSQIEDSQACLQAQLVLVDRLTAEKDGMAAKLARVREEAGRVAAELENVRKETKRYGPETVERMVLNIKLLASSSKELRSALSEERKLGRDLREQLNESAVQRIRVTEDRETLIERLAQMQTCDSMATG